MADTTELSLFTSELQRLVQTLIRTYEKCDHDCVKRLGVTATQGTSLLVFQEEGDMTMKELSELMGLAESTMTRVVDQLVGKDLVKRDLDANDRRVVRVSLTQDGRIKRTALEKSLNELLAQGLGGLGKEDRNAILASLRKLVSAVEAICKKQCWK